MGSKRFLSPVADAPGPAPSSAVADPTPHGWELDEQADLTVIRQLLAEGTLLVRVVGEVDLVTAPCLATALELTPQNRRTSRDVTEIVVDLGLVRFLSAAGLRELVRAHQRCRHDGILLRVVADQRAVTTPLRLTGLDHTLGLRPDLDIPGDVAIVLPPVISVPVVVPAEA